MSVKPLTIGELTARIPVIQGGMGVGVSLSGLAGAVESELFPRPKSVSGNRIIIKTPMRPICGQSDRKSSGRKSWRRAESSA